MSLYTLGKRSNFLSLYELVIELARSAGLAYAGKLYKNLYFEHEGKKYVYELREIADESPDLSHP